MKRTKVVIGINDFLVGGAQKFIADLLKHMDETRFEFVVITLFFWKDHEYFYDLLPDSVIVHKLDFRGFADARSWLRLYRLLREIKPEVVLSNLFFSNTLFRVLSVILRYSVITVEHNTYTNKAKIERLVDRLLARLTFKIVAVSKTVKEFTIVQEKIDADRFTVIHNGIDLTAIQNRCALLPEAGTLRKQFGIADDEIVLLNVSRLSKQKNHELLLSGFSRLSQRLPHIRLHLVGNGPERDRLESLARELNIIDRVTFFGMRQDVERFYKSSDLFVSSSDIEGLSIAYLEALSCGLPLVATKTAGTDELIQEGRNGFFIEPATPSQVAVVIEKAIAADASSLRRNALAYVQEFDILYSARRYEALLAAAAGY